MCVQQEYDISNCAWRWSWVRRMRICAPNVWAIGKENLDFLHRIFELYFILGSTRFAGTS